MKNFPLPGTSRDSNSGRRVSHLTQLTRLTFLTFLLFLLAGCYATKPLKGGRAVTSPKPDGGLEQTLIPPDNPAQPSRQEQESIKVRSYTVPAGSRIETAFVPAATAPTNLAVRTSSGAAGAVVPSSILDPRFTLSAAMPVVEREEIRAHTEIGAAQKDTARELGAKLASLKSLTWVGLLLFVFGLASIFWPPLQAIIGSVTTSIAITLGGVALMILPSLVIGHELLILGGVCLGVGAWFIAHRHGQLRGLVDSALPAPPASTQPLSPPAPPANPSIH